MLSFLAVCVLAYAAQVLNVRVLAILVLILLGLLVFRTIVPQLAVTVRRLHDSGLSGGMYFLSWIPFAGGIIMLVMLLRPSDPSGARFDLVPGRYPQHPGAYQAPHAPAPAAYAPAPAAYAPAPAAYAPAPAAYAPARQSGLTAPVVPLPPAASVPVAPGRPGAEWQIVLTDGRRIAVASALRLGRDPLADPAAPGAVLVPIDDPAKSLSKTHAQLQGGTGELIITDLHSTNGTTVRTADGSEVLLVPGSGYRVTGDAELLLGDHSIRLQRQPGL